MKKIRFSAGHGIGSRYNRGGLYFNEGDENFSATNRIISKLNEKYKVDVNEIRKEKGNYDHSPSTRSSYGNGADLFYSWHSNAGKGKGCEVILSYQSLKYIDFARDLCRVISETLDIPNRGVKFRNNYTEKFETYEQAKSNSTNYYGELRGNKADCAIIVEHFFHDTETDSKKYLENKWDLATEVAKCIAYHFGLPKKNNNVVNDRIDLSNIKLLYKVTEEYMNTRNADKKLVGKVYKNDVLAITDLKDDWGKIEDKDKWVYLGMLKPVETFKVKANEDMNIRMTSENDSTVVGHSDKGEILEINIIKDGFGYNPKKKGWLYLGLTDLIN